MRAALWLSVGCLALLLTACSSKPKDIGFREDSEDVKQFLAAVRKHLILGKWVAADSQVTLTFEFAKDGKVVMTSGPATTKGSYRFIDDKNLEVELDNPFGLGDVHKKLAAPEGKNAEVPTTVKQRMGVSVSQDELTITREGGKAEKYKRGS